MMILYPADKSVLEMAQLFATSALFCVAIWAIIASRRSQREQTARNAYLRYLELAIQHPPLAFPNWNDVDLKNEYFGSSHDDSKRKEMFERYEWFLSFLLNTASLVWKSVSKKHVVADLMKLQIAYHWRYFDHFKADRRFLKLWYEIHGREIDEGIRKGREHVRGADGRDE